MHSVWDRFEVFEALHHSMQICNPMTSGELDEVLDEALDAFTADRSPTQVLDVACGYGETLFRLADRVADLSGVCVDLSPWMMNEAVARHRARVPDADLRWVLGEARDFEPDTPVDLGVCVGAEWIWHGFNGTARAMSQRVVAGGVVMIGAARLHHRADPVGVAESRGKVETVDDMAAMLREHNLEPLHRVDPDDSGWDAYLDRTRTAAVEWAQRYPGERAELWLAAQADWQAARERDRDIIGWSLWIARRNPVSA